MKSKYDIRVLCRGCLSDMISCGYKLIRTKEKCTDECWKCQVKQGFEYRVRQVVIVIKTMLKTVTKAQERGDLYAGGSKAYVSNILLKRS